MRRKHVRFDASLKTWKWKPAFDLHLRVDDGGVLLWVNERFEAADRAEYAAEQLRAHQDAISATGLSWEARDTAARRAIADWDAYAEEVLAGHHQSTRPPVPIKMVFASRVSNVADGVAIANMRDLYRTSYARRSDHPKLEQVCAAIQEFMFLQQLPFDEEGGAGDLA